MVTRDTAETLGALSPVPFLVICGTLLASMALLVASCWAV